MVRYIGNKTNLLDFIHTEIINVCGNLSDVKFCDLFAGSGSVGRYFKQFCFEVTTNDLEMYSYVLCRNYVGNNTYLTEAYDIIAELNNLTPLEGRFYENFSPAGGRMFFTEYNAKKIDAIRQHIERYQNYPDLYFFLLASLIESADSISNTTGVYGAFLKSFNGKSQKNIILEPAIFKKGANGICYNKNANDLIKTISGDILYLDPPYNNRVYGANYHILNYLVDYYAFEFNTESKTALGEYNKSDYSTKKNAARAFEELISNADYKYIFVSYNNEGIMTFEQMKDIMSKYGEYSLKSKDYKRYKSNSHSQKTNSVLEYLHVLQK